MSKYAVQDLGQNYQDALESVLERTTHDEAFRQQVIDTPHAAIEVATGTVIPEDVKLKFFNAQDYDFAFILPDPVSEELSESELEYVAGGAGCWCLDDTEVDVCQGDIL